MGAALIPSSAASWSSSQWALFMQVVVERAIQIAGEARAGVMEMNGKPYVFHPLRVMLKQTSPEAMIVGVLHHVVADGPARPMSRIEKEPFPREVFEALALVTKLEGLEPSTDEGYQAFVSRCAANPIARAAKRAYIEDNMDISRSPNPADQKVGGVEESFAPTYATLSMVCWPPLSHRTTGWLGWLNWLLRKAVTR